MDIDITLGGIEEISEWLEELPSRMDLGLKVFVDSAASSLLESLDKSLGDVESKMEFISPIIEIGKIRRGLTSVVGEDSAAVGAAQEDDNPLGYSFDDMLDILESGAIIDATDEVREWFAKSGRPLEKDTEFLLIPPRDIMDSAVAAAEIERLIDTFLEFLA